MKLTPLFMVLAGLLWLEAALVIGTSAPLLSTVLGFGGVALLGRGLALVAGRFGGAR